MMTATATATETEADYDREAEYFAANDEMRYLARLLDDADDDNYEERYANWKRQSNLVAEIRQTLT
jgi:hypothetical protein